MARNDDRERRRRYALVSWSGFYRCPTTGRIIEAMTGDDKALCYCRQSNPRVPSERTEETGVHIVRFLAAATVDEYLDQQESSRLRDAVDRVRKGERP